MGYIWDMPSVETLKRHADFTKRQMQTNGVPSTDATAAADDAEQHDARRRKDAEAVARAMEMVR